MSITAIDLYYNGATANKTVSVKKYFTKVKPVLSFVKNTDNELVVSISNPSSSDKSFTITAFAASGNVSTASLNKQDVATGGAIATDKQVTVSK
jgi:dihydroorotase